MAAVIICALELGFAYSGEDASPALAVIARLLTTTTSHGGDDWPVFAEHARQHGGSGAVHGVARGGFDSLQIETAGMALAGGDHLQQSSYFGGDFLLDRRGRFFSWIVTESSTGRARQIASFTSSSLRLSSRNW